MGTFCNPPIKSSLCYGVIWELTGNPSAYRRGHCRTRRAASRATKKPGEYNTTSGSMGRLRVLPGASPEGYSHPGVSILGGGPVFISIIPGARLKQNLANYPILIPFYSSPY